MEQMSSPKQYHVHYGSASSMARVDIGELWRYKDLIWLFVKRDFTVLYKQTVLGPAWILINPLLSTAMYTVMFGVIAQLSTGGVPQVPFYLAGTALWGLFSSCINKVSGTFTTNSTIFSKVYFPRLAMPISTMISGMINFLVQFALFFIVMLFYVFTGQLSPNWAAMPLLVPILLQVRHHRFQRYNALSRFDDCGDFWCAALDVRYAGCLPAVNAGKYYPAYHHHAESNDGPDGKLPCHLPWRRRMLNTDVVCFADLDSYPAGCRSLAFQQGRKDLCRYRIRGRV